MTHANVMPAEEEMKQLRAGKVGLDLRFPAVILLHVLAALSETMSAGVEPINRHFARGKDKEIATHERAILTARGSYRDSLQAVI